MASTAYAFIGTGAMGRPMAANLVKAGHDVTVWNRTPKSLEGARTAATPAEAATAALATGSKAATFIKLLSARPKVDKDAVQQVLTAKPAPKGD